MIGERYIGIINAKALAVLDARMLRIS